MMRKEQAKEQKEHWLFYAAVFFCFWALYAFTAQRGVSWQDSGEFQYRILVGDYQWYSGIARAHPLYIAMARGFVALFPKAAFFYAVNLFSGLGLSLALALLANNVVRMTLSVWAAVMAVSVLGFAHMAWWLGTVAEVYTWSLAFLMAEILCLIRYSENRDGRWLIVLFGVNGLHGSLHNAAFIGVPVYAFLLMAELWRRRGKGVGTVCGCAAAWLLGGGMLVWQAACLLRETGEPILVLKRVLFGNGYEGQVLGTAGFVRKLWVANMALAGVSVMNPCWVFAGRGLFLRVENGQRKVRTWLLVLTGLHGLFWIRYFVPDQATFVVPTLGFLALWAGVGAGKAGGAGRGGAMRTGFLPPAADGGYASEIQVRPAPPRPAPECGKGADAMRTGFLPPAADGGYASEIQVRPAPPRSAPECGKGAGAMRTGFLPPAADAVFLRRGWWLAAGVVCAVAGPWLLSETVKRIGIDVTRSRVLPFRSEMSYWLVPWKQGEDSAERFVSEVGKCLVAGDVLLADATAAGPLMAAREAGMLSKEWRLVTPWSGEADGEVLAWVGEGSRKVYVVSPVAGYAPKSLLEAGCRFESAGVVYRVTGNRQPATCNGQ
ncbi:MAG: hypothetical protein WCK89_14185 [bacterium]